METHKNRSIAHIKDVKFSQIGYTLHYEKFQVIRWRVIKYLIND